MTVQEEWRELRTAGPGMERQALAEAFCGWSERFTAEDEGESGGCFRHWRRLPSAVRQAKLRQAVRGGIPEMGAGPQLELALLVALFQVLRQGRCFISLAASSDPVLIRAAVRRFQDLDSLVIQSVGMLGDRSGLKLSDCVKAQVVIIDHYILATVLRSNPELFSAGLPIFFVEIDSCLYCNRLVFYERSVPRASGLIYNSEVSVPSWAGNPAIFDTVLEMKRLGLEICGSYSLVDRFTAGEMNKLLRDRVVGRIRGSRGIGFSAFTYRTSGLRNGAVVRDVQKCPTNAIIVCLTEGVVKDMQEALRKSGVEFTVTMMADDVATALALAKPGNRRVIIYAGMPTSQTAAPPERLPGALFLAECYLTDNYQAKMIAMSQRLMDCVQAPRLYYSLEDRLMAIYAQEGGFGRLFDVIEFTERYDPWYQIRRVLAKAMLRKLNRMRAALLDDEAPIPSLPLTGRASSAGGGRAKASRGAQVEALCFCGSGKPFKECHGKRK
jgi:hypothetical protein